MENEFRERHTKRYASMRSLVDYAMGALYLAAAAFLLFGGSIEFLQQHFDKTFRYIFGGLLALYGAWRVYRGYKKDYF